MARKKPRRTWVWAPRKPTPPVPDDFKAEAKANALIREFLEPMFVKPPTKDERWNYPTGISAKWHRSCLYYVGH